MAARHTRNPGSGKLVLGRYFADDRPGNSYHKVAAHYGSTYFKVDVFRDVVKAFGLSDNEVWGINKAFLEQQLAHNPDVVLSYDPAQALAGTFYEREVNYLLDRGYTFRKKTSGRGKP